MWKISKPPCTLKIGWFAQHIKVEVLIEKESKRSDAHWSGRNSQNTVVVFPKENYKVGEFVMVKITDCTAATLIGEAVGYSEIMN